MKLLKSAPLLVPFVTLLSKGTHDRSFCNFILSSWKIAGDSTVFEAEDTLDVFALLEVKLY